jgi:hypothetical protein
MKVFFKYNIKALYAVLAVVSVGMAQSVYIRGTVTGTGGVALSGALVKLEKGGQTDTTASNGSFTLAGDAAGIGSQINPSRPRKLSATVRNGWVYVNIAEKSTVEITTFNLNGKAVSAVLRTMDAGPHALALPRRGAGVYWSKVKAGSSELVIKSILIGGVVQGTTGATQRTSADDALAKQAAAAAVINDIIAVTKTGYWDHRMILTNSDTSGLEIEMIAPPAPPAAHSLEAVKLLDYISSIKGTSCFAGEHEYNFDNMSYLDAVYGITGKYPALYETELAMTMGESPARAVELRDYVVEKAMRWWNEGGVVGLTWHECLPGSPVQDFLYCQQSITQEKFNLIVTTGTADHTLLLSEIDEIAVYLKKLRDAHVPVLWRPYHEMNGGWFWWGEKTNYASLWNILYDRLLNYHGLNNLIWVFGPNAPYFGAGAASTYYPGHAKVDILAHDVYLGGSLVYLRSWRDDLVTLGAGRPVALAECGVLPTASQLNGIYSNTVWFMSWREQLTDYNTCDQINALYNDPRIITRDELPLLTSTPVPPTFPPVFPPPPAGNLVQNPGFESGTLHWTLEPVYTLVTEDKHTGSYAVKLTGKGEWNNLFQKPVPCVPQTNYTCSFWVKSSSVTALRLWNSAWTARIFMIQTVANGTWTRYSVDFNSMHFSGLMLDFTDTNKPNPGITYIDDVEILQKN